MLQILSLILSSQPCGTRNPPRYVICKLDRPAPATSSAVTRGCTPLNVSGSAQITAKRPRMKLTNQPSRSPRAENAAKAEAPALMSPKQQGPAPDRLHSRDLELREGALLDLKEPRVRPTHPPKLRCGASRRTRTANNRREAGRGSSSQPSWRRRQLLATVWTRVT
jgi:hypothetical protein